MMELILFLQICMGFFAVIGFLHGIYREIVATIGIILGLFILTQFDWIISLFFGRGDAAIRFLIDSFLIALFTFFAYQQAPNTFVPSRYRGSRGKAKLPEFDGWQMKLVSATLGAFNGYLVFGSIWYLMDQYEYPMPAWVAMPALDSSSADFVTRLPLVWLQQGNLMLFIVMAFFVMIYVFR